MTLLGLRRGRGVTDKRVLKLIRAFLKSGVMEDGLVSPVDEMQGLRNTSAAKRQAGKLC
jgi:hypothetical protein